MVKQLSCDTSIHCRGDLAKTMRCLGLGCVTIVSMKRDIKGVHSVNEVSRFSIESWSRVSRKQTLFFSLVHGHLKKLQFDL